MILHGSYPPEMMVVRRSDGVDDTHAGMWKFPHMSY